MMYMYGMGTPINLLYSLLMDTLWPCKDSLFSLLKSLKSVDSDNEYFVIWNPPR